MVSKEEGQKRKIKHFLFNDDVKLSKLSGNSSFVQSVRIICNNVGMVNALYLL